MTDNLSYACEDAGSPPSLFPDYRSTVLRSPTPAGDPHPANPDGNDRPGR